ncbi:phage tail tape measure protein [Pandoraea norimbergensis]|uniref:Phage tail tape measure protein n=1 Tax=Pandoraea norimbergensis TaxID=93219 RepID=A0ABM5WJJ4_9BURK|nr:phage tail tape measure protein [Pandoraea norimbergensis]ALS60666.1 phage tail tape measure protein [Pandoraea norimbergensis]ALS61997.1 phage tail tape measure protein [Pandoraea norimbergensis]
MASEFYVGVKIGATMLASFGTALAGAKTTMSNLGRVADDLQVKHARLGEVMSRAMAHPMRNVGELRHQYERLGTTMDALTTKQAALAGQLARGEALHKQRMGLGGEMVGTYLTAKATAAPLIGAVKQAATFEAGLRDIAITGNLTKQEEFKVGEAVRQAALSTSQGHAAILEGVGTLVAAGMDANKAGEYSGLLGKVATATNADMKDLAGMVYSLSETLGIKGDTALKEAFNRAAFGGKLGRFELKDMAKALPEMTAAFASKGIKGQDALTQIIASLEVGREGAGSGDEAVTNLRNWLSHMNAKHTIDAYSKAGVDYQKSMQNLVSDGYSSYEASLQIAQKFISSRGDGFMKQWKDAGAKGDEEAQRRLMESFGLNEVFQDIQTINHLLAMRQGWDKYQDNKKKMGSQEAMGTIDEDYRKRAELATKAWERFKTRVADVGITVGSTLMPSLTKLLGTLTPMIDKIGQFAAAHPGVIRAVAGFAVSIVGLKVATLALGWGLNFFVKSPLNLLGTAFTTVSSKWTLMRALLLGGSSRLATVFQLFGASTQTATKLASVFGRLGGWMLSLGRATLLLGRFLLPFGQGLLMTFGGPLMLAARGSLFLGRLLVGNLLPGLRLAGQAVLWLGRAMLMNPLGLAVTAIGVAAYLVWKNWDKVKSAILVGWNWLKGLKDRFFSAGADLINGLVSGVTSKISAARDSIVSFGSDIKGWFANTLGIRSPSRVFMGFGDNIAQGAALGIGRSAGLASRAAAGMASDTAAAAATQHIAAGRLGSSSASAGTSGMTVQFSPTIHVQGGSPEAVKGQVTDALNLSLRELEQMIKRVTAQQARRAY